MSQVRDRRVLATEMVRSRAWRAGYAACRRGENARFLERGSKALAYEYGRLTAAWLIGEGRGLPWISERRPLPERLVHDMAAALLDCAAAAARDARPRASPRAAGDTAGIGRGGT